MPTQHFFPKVEADRIPWLENYASNLVKYASLLGLAGEETTAILKDITYYGWLLRTWNPAAQQFAVDATTLKNNIATGSGVDPMPVPVFPSFADAPPPVAPGVVNRLFNQIQRIKLHPAYTDGIGHDLGIISTAKNEDHPVPVFTAALEQGPQGSRVRLDFSKYGHGGIAIESRINNGLWLPLDHFTQKTVYDERPLAIPGTPESRDYRMRWWDKDQANGEWSAVQTVLVGS